MVSFTLSCKSCVGLLWTEPEAAEELQCAADLCWPGPVDTPQLEEPPAQGQSSQQRQLNSSSQGNGAGRWGQQRLSSGRSDVNVLFTPVKGLHLNDHIASVKDVSGRIFFFL